MLQMRFFLNIHACECYILHLYIIIHLCVHVYPVHVPSWMVYGMTFDIERCGQILRTIDNFFIFFQNHSFSLF